MDKSYLAVMAIATGFIMAVRRTILIANPALPHPPFPHRHTTISSLPVPSQARRCPAAIRAASELQAS